jgi:hypothetical protein
MVRHGRDCSGVGARRPLMSVMISGRKYSLSPSMLKPYLDSDASLLRVIKHIAFYGAGAEMGPAALRQSGIAIPLASPPLISWCSWFGLHPRRDSGSSSCR